MFWTKAARHGAGTAFGMAAGEGHSWTATTCRLPYAAIKPSTAVEQRSKRMMPKIHAKVKNEGEEVPE